MEKLEKKLIEILDLTIDSYSINDYDSDIITGKEDSTKQIAQEVKDIAIAFARHLAENGHQILAVNGKTKDFLFTDFIQTYYK